MGVRKSTGIIIGSNIGGNDSNDSKFVSTKVGGVTVKFQPGENLPFRQVNIGNNMSITAGAGFSQTMNVNGIQVRSQDGELWVNGEKVDFSGQGQAATSKLAPPSNPLKELETRYPGVAFSGNPQAVNIDDSVQIAAGATIELNPGLELSGNTVIGANARVTGGSIEDTRVDGEVNGGQLEASTVEANAQVNGGNLERVRLAGGATVNGGIIEDSTLEAGATVNGGILEKMTLGKNSIVNGGVLENFELAPGQAINGGTHKGKLTRDGAPSAETVVVQNLRKGKFDNTTTQQMASFARVMGNLNVRQNVGTVGPGASIVGVQIGKIG
jgi:hypothetical protein